MSHRTNKPGRLLIAQLMTDLCNGNVPGGDFVRHVGDLDADRDEVLEMVQWWIIATFDPDFEHLSFDRDDPPYSVRRQFALFRRFLLADAQYR